MANDLRQLTPHIDQLRERISLTADVERSHVQSLSDALRRFDQETLQSVRNLAADHEARRGGILNELQALASSIGTFPPARETVQLAIQRQAEPMLSYHDELEVNLRALLAEGSRR